MVAPLILRIATALPTLRLVDLGQARLDHRWHPPLTGPWWRLYHHRKHDGGTLILQGPGFRLEPADRAVVLIPPWTGTSGLVTGEVDQVFLHWDQGPLPDPWVRRHLDRPLVLPPDPAHDQRADALRAAVLGPLGATLHLELQAWGPLCLAQAIDHLPPAVRADLDQTLAGLDPLAPALARLAADPVAPLDLEGLAHACGLSRTRFAHRFRERLGTTPGRWQVQQRLARAVQSLVSTDTPIEAIAEAVGFANRFHFSRLFRQHLGESPAAYRSRHQHARLHAMATNETPDRRPPVGR